MWAKCLRLSRTSAKGWSPSKPSLMSYEQPCSIKWSHCSNSWRPRLKSPGVICSLNTTPTSFKSKPPSYLMAAMDTSSFMCQWLPRTPYWLFKLHPFPLNYVWHPSPDAGCEKRHPQDLDHWHQVQHAVVIYGPRVLPPHQPGYNLRLLWGRVKKV